MADAERKLSNGKSRIDFQTDPSRYRHWKLSVDGDVATLLMDVDEKGALFEGYELKLNSYDLGVDIELADAIERLRFEHPEVRVILLRSGKPRVFCAGANIRMLAGASHAHKVNFCKFTNETRNGIEDASEYSGPPDHLRHQRHGGGRRLRACARGRPHHAGRRRLLDGVAAGTAAARGAARHRRAHPRHRQAQGAARPRRRVLHHRGRRQGQARGRLAAGGRGRARLEVRGDGGQARQGIRGEIQPADGRQRHCARRRSSARARQMASTTRPCRSNLRAPSGSPPSRCADRRRRRPHRPTPWWRKARSSGRCKLARELDDAILDIRANEFDAAAIVFKSSGDPAQVLAYDAFLDANKDHLAGARNQGAVEARRSSASISRRVRWSR